MCCPVWLIGLFLITFYVTFSFVVLFKRIYFCEIKFAYFNVQLEISFFLTFSHLSIPLVVLSRNPFQTLKIISFFIPQTCFSSFSLTSIYFISSRYWNRYRIQKGIELKGIEIQKVRFPKLKFSSILFTISVKWPESKLQY